MSSEFNKTFPGATKAPSADPEIQIKEEKNASVPGNVSMDPTAKVSVAHVKEELELFPDDIQQNINMNYPDSHTEKVPSTSKIASQAVLATVANPEKLHAPVDYSAPESFTNTKIKAENKLKLESSMDAKVMNSVPPMQDEMKDQHTDASAVPDSNKDHIEESDAMLSGLEHDDFLEKSIAAMSTAHTQLVKAQLENQRQSSDLMKFLSQQQEYNQELLTKLTEASAKALTANQVLVKSSENVVSGDIVKVNISIDDFIPDDKSEKGDPYLHVTKFKRIATANNWSVLQQATRFAVTLKGRAAWFFNSYSSQQSHSMKSQEDIDKLYRTFIDAFDTPKSRSTRAKEFRNMRQGATESVDCFVWRLTEMYNRYRSAFTTNDLFDAAKDGFLEDIYNEMYMDIDDNTTFEQLVNKAKVVEKALKDKATRLAERRNIARIGSAANPIVVNEVSVSEPSPEAKVVHSGYAPLYTQPEVGSLPENSQILAELNELKTIINDMSVKRKQYIEQRQKDKREGRCYDCHEKGHRVGDPACKKPSRRTLMWKNYRPQSANTTASVQIIPAKEAQSSTTKDMSKGESLNSPADSSQ